MDCTLPGSYVHGGSPGKSTGVGCHALLWRIFPTQGSNLGLPHCRQILHLLSHQGSPWILGWVAYLFSRGSSRPRNWTGVSCIVSGFFTSWATREAPSCWSKVDFCVLKGWLVCAGLMLVWGTRRASRVRLEILPLFLEDDFVCESDSGRMLTFSWKNLLRCCHRLLKKPWYLSRNMVNPCGRETSFVQELFMHCMFYIHCNAFLLCIYALHTCMHTMYALHTMHTFMHCMFYILCLCYILAFLMLYFSFPLPPPQIKSRLMLLYINLWLFKCLISPFNFFVSC